MICKEKLTKHSNLLSQNILQNMLSRKSNHDHDGFLFSFTSPTLDIAFRNIVATFTFFYITRPTIESGGFDREFASLLINSQIEFLSPLIGTMERDVRISFVKLFRTFTLSIETFVKRRN